MVVSSTKDFAFWSYKKKDPDGPKDNILSEYIYGLC